MNPLYREYVPPPDLAPFVECFWTSDIEADGCRRILPDGCLDLLFVTRGRQLVDAQVVGVMTRAHDVRLLAGQSILGVRFQPGMASLSLPLDIPSLNDRSVPIQSVFGDDFQALLVAVGECRSVEARIERLTQRLATVSRIGAVHRAFGELVGRRGQLSVTDLADLASLSERQLRRVCLELSGLSPKQLARILRFRHAISRIRRSLQIDLASLAMDCGYYDQAHMVRDFREFAGVSPTRFSRRSSG